VGNPKSKGTILIAFGTMGDWKTAPREVLEVVKKEK
jgi:hypothetical protein